MESETGPEIICAGGVCTVLSVEVAQLRSAMRVCIRVKQDPLFELNYSPFNVKEAREVDKDGGQEEGVGCQLSSK